MQVSKGQGEREGGKERVTVREFQVAQREREEGFVVT